MATACHWLDVRTATARFAKDLDLLVPLDFSDTGALLLGYSRYAIWREIPKTTAIFELPEYLISA